MDHHTEILGVYDYYRMHRELHKNGRIRLITPYTVTMKTYSKGNCILRFKQVFQETWPFMYFQITFLSGIRVTYYFTKKLFLKNMIIPLYNLLLGVLLHPRGLYLNGVLEFE